MDEAGLAWIWNWWPGTELNRRHKDFQSSALPTELLGLLIVTYEMAGEGLSLAIAKGAKYSRTPFPHLHNRR